MYWLDTTILAVLAVGAALGAMSGFLRQLARLLGVAAAVYAAVFLNDWAARAFQDALLHEADPRVARGLAYVAVFLVVYLFFFYTTRLLQVGIRAAHLEGMDRLLGACFGVGKMTLLLAVVFFGMATYPHPSTQALLEKSVLAPALAGGMEHVLVFVPERYQADLAEGVRNLRELGRPRPDPAPEPAAQPAPTPPVPEKAAPEEPKVSPYYRPGWGYGPPAEDDPAG